jgi:hypothetical protein
MAEDNSKQTIIIGLSAIIVTLLMADGLWSVFDFGVSISIIAFGYFFLKKHEILPLSKRQVLLFALPFAMLTTAALIALVLALAVFFPNFATVDFRTFKQIFPTDKTPEAELYMYQTGWQFALFTVSLVIWFFVLYFRLPLKIESNEKEEKEM